MSGIGLKMQYNVTPNEVWRTAFKEIPQQNWESPYGYKHPDKDPNQMCVYCKNEDTDVVRDSAVRELYSKEFKDQVEKFTVMYCSACTAQWSYYVARSKQ